MVDRIKGSILLVFFLLITITASFAQQTGIIQGRLADTVNYQVLKDAFITVISTSDTTIKRQTFSGGDASFKIPSLPLGNYLLQIHFVGFEPFIQAIQLDEGHPVSSLGTIYLHIQIRTLDTVNVEEEAIVIKKDTVEYNSSRFKTRAYAPLADLLEKLPGIRLNRDGAITMNGLPIDQILVDGKPFFNGDPQMALQHLPAEIIRKIQVYTSTTQQSGMPPPPGSHGPKTLNLILKGNRRKGEFGKLAAGAGPAHPVAYNVSADINHMNGPQQISLITDAGNADAFNDKQNGNSRPGINRNLNAGVNYRNNWNDKTNMYGSYTNGYQHAENIQRIHTLNLFPGDSSTILNQNNNTQSDNNQQRLNLTIEHKPNAANTFTFRPVVTLQHTATVSNQQVSQTFANSGADIYRSAGENSNTDNNKKLSAGLQYIHKDSQLRMLYLGLDIYNDQNNRNGFSTANTSYTNYTNTLNQHSSATGHSFTISPSVTYTTPIGVDIQASYSMNSSNMINQTFRFNNDTKEYDVPDKAQSNNFDNNYHTGKATVSYRKQWKNYGIIISSGVESDQLKGKDNTKNDQVSSRYVSILPSATLNVDLGNNKTFQFNYSGKPLPLNVQQLQPVSYTTDSLFIQQGNPLLKQPYSHAVNMMYSSLSLGTQQFFTAMLTGSITKNAVQNAVTLLHNGAQITMPVNLNGAATIYANLNYTIPFLKQGSNLNVTSNIRYTQDPVLSNGVKNNTQMLNVAGALAWDYHSDKGFDGRLSSNAEYNIINTTLTRNNYLIISLVTRLSYIKGDWTAQISGFYEINNSLPAGYQPLAPVLSPGISRRLLRRKAAEIKLTVMDMLNQQSGASRMITSNTITDIWSMTRGRYLLLSFTYNLNRFKVK